MLNEQRIKRQEDLEDRLERARTEAREMEEDLRTVEDDLQLTSQKATYELKKISHEKSILEDEVQMLRRKLAERDAKLIEKEKKLAQREAALRHELKSMNDEIRSKDRTIMLKNDEIRSYTSRTPDRTPPRKEEVDTISINGNGWEETSALTNSSEFDIILSKYEKPAMYRRTMSNSSSKKRHNELTSIAERDDDRDDLNARRLNVSFSDDVEKRALPMQVHDNLSKRLEKMYLHR